MGLSSWRYERGNWAWAREFGVGGKEGDGRESKGG